MEVLVLVLNANFEPINVCNTRRALGLMLSGKADLVANGRGYVRTVSRALPRPSVIRLGHMVHRPHARVKLTRREIFRRDSFICQYCGRHGNDMTVDHVVPRHMGGLHVWHNVVTACAPCNHRKGGRRVEDSHMSLLHPPKEPPATASYIFGKHLGDNQDWLPFIQGW